VAADAAAERRAGQVTPPPASRRRRIHPARGTAGDRARRYPHEFGWESGSGIVYLIFLATMLLTGVVALMRREVVP
jgi:hypothetical protein